MPAESWFPIVIGYEYLHQVDTKPLIKRAYEIKEQYSMTATWNCETYTSVNDYAIHDDEIFSPLLRAIMPHLKNFTELHSSEPLEILNVESWVNIASKGHNQEFHIHPNNHFSIVFYLQTDEDCGDIVFENPNVSNNMMQLPKCSDNTNPFNLPSVVYKAEDKKLLMFPSYLRHMVRTNRSNKDRISVSMNISLK
jgi:uncharacterized protein (TIGR02466 family)